MEMRNTGLPLYKVVWIPLHLVNLSLRVGPQLWVARDLLSPVSWWVSFKAFWFINLIKSSVCHQWSSWDGTNRLREMNHGHHMHPHPLTQSHPFVQASKGSESWEKSVVALEWVMTNRRAPWFKTQRYIIPNICSVLLVFSLLTRRMSNMEI